MVLSICIYSQLTAANPRCMSFQTSFPSEEVFGQASSKRAPRADLVAYAIMAEQVLDKCRLFFLIKTHDNEETIAYLRVQGNLWGDWLDGDTLVEHVVRLLTARHAHNPSMWFAAATAIAKVFPDATPIVRPDFPAPRVVFCTIDL